jgi:class 3 adenylate cyclase
VALREDLIAEVNATFTGGRWDTQDAVVIPDPAALRLNSNHAKYLESATVLYADIDGSTVMVDTYHWWFAAEVYKAYLRCASQIIKSEGGSITAYDGDRVMAIFTGDYKNTNAVRCALKINLAVEQIIWPAIFARYPKTKFLLRHVIGIDTSPLHAARIGIHGENDLVWVGRAANYAAKLCTLSNQTIFVTQDVYDAMNAVVKLYLTGGNAWTRYSWTPQKMDVYGTTAIWTVI